METKVKAKPLTLSQKQLLRDMPEGWFTPDVIQHHAHGPDGRCRKFVELGLCEARSNCPPEIKPLSEEYVSWLRSATFLQQYRKVPQVGTRFTIPQIARPTGDGLWHVEVQQVDWVNGLVYFNWWYTTTNPDIMKLEDFYQQMRAGTLKIEHPAP